MGKLLQSLIPFTAYPYTGESIPCNLCGSDRKTLISDTDRRWKPLKTVACSDCGLMRTDPMPTEAELDSYYRNEYRIDYQLAGRRPPKFHLVRSMREAENRAAFLKDVLKPGARVLDFGCGTGEFLKLAKERGCEVVGIEPGRMYAEFARAEYDIEVINAPWQKVVLPSGGFDVVACQQVLEHLRDPMAALSAMANWLKHDGVLYMSVPDMRPNNKPSFERFHFAHIYGFTPETLELSLRRHGMIPATGSSLSTTTSTFRKQPGLSVESVMTEDPGRAARLAESYCNDSIAGYVFGGGYFRHAAHRFEKWRRDQTAKHGDPGRT